MAATCLASLGGSRLPHRIAGARCGGSRRGGGGCGSGSGGGCGCGGLLGLPVGWACRAGRVGAAGSHFPAAEADGGLGPHGTFTAAAAGEPLLQHPRPGAGAGAGSPPPQCNRQQQEQQQQRGTAGAGSLPPRGPQQQASGGGGVFFGSQLLQRAGCDDAEGMLRRCLARSLLRRLAEAGEAREAGDSGEAWEAGAAAASLEHLGVARLCATPPAPPEFAAFAAEVEREPWALERHLGAPAPYVGYLTSSGKRCLLAPGESVRRFTQPAVESFLLSIFHAAAAQAAPEVTLSAHCLFHAHLFLARAPARGVGLLLHAAEYPRLHPDAFPYALGHCQEDSPLAPSPQQLARRNLLWYQGRLAVLDVSPGTALRGLLWAGTRELCTVYEEDLGRPLADLTLDLPAAPGRLMVTPRAALGGGGGAAAAFRV